MERDTAIGITLLVGVVAIAEAVGALMYRVGRFSLMPGELRRLALNGAIGLAIAIAFPFLTQFFASSAQLVLGLIVLASVGYLLLTRGRRARILQERSPEGLAELERRTTFLRSRRGRWLFVAMFLGMLLWSVATAFIWAAS
jgi:hypothetical protein